MGESKTADSAVASACEELVKEVGAKADTGVRVQTPGGVFTVHWDERGGATAMGQLTYFAQYLETTGLFESWIKSCPLKYTSPNAPEIVDVLGTWMLPSWTDTGATPM